MKSLAIIGAGGHGKVVADIASECGFTLIDFFDDGKQPGQKIGAWEVSGTVDDLERKYSDYTGIFVAIGHNETRANLMKRFAYTKLVTLIHPSSVVSTSAQIGTGTVVMPRAVINAFSAVGNGVIINTATVIEHDCHIGDYSHISPGAVLSGTVHIGQYCWLGANCSIKQNITIGTGAVVGIGSVVIRDVRASVTVIGSPATELKK
ncbi:acetyltransferase [Enterovibrio norvegicus]|uniref:Pilin glycosylation protein n=1 Tax=Enterovibrio norvegicus TaxID=188144 RepID=A0A2N7L5S4_9GAMM|nr:acetyltransferase [Enterovibrio norvegicus]PML80844.1 pilin glycosylation protein [Enterovibrio norvegicus]PMN67374.1 pilin glycosylation protein [Enterovibrio norvegicus]PMN88929.1 pilin glycosylation protein [Enterovibrio norvegicus]